MSIFTSTIISSVFDVIPLQGGNSGYDWFYASGGESVFTLHNSANFVPGSTMVYVNNVYQSFTSYVETNGTTITFNSAVSNGVSVEVRYLQPFTPYVNPTTTTVTTGAMLSYSWLATNNTLFTLPIGQLFVLGSTLVYVNGIYQQPNVDYTELSNQQSISFTNNVPLGYLVQIRYVFY